MVNPNPNNRPTANDILHHPLVSPYLNSSLPPSSRPVSSDSTLASLTPLADLLWQWEEDSVQVSLDMEEVN